MARPTTTNSSIQFAKKRVALIKDILVKSKVADEVDNIGAAHGHDVYGTLAETLDAKLTQIEDQYTIAKGTAPEAVQFKTLNGVRQ